MYLERAVLSAKIAVGQSIDGSTYRSSWVTSHDHTPMIDPEQSVSRLRRSCCNRWASTLLGVHQVCSHCSVHPSGHGGTSRTPGPGHSFFSQLGQVLVLVSHPPSRHLELQCPRVPVPYLLFGMVMCSILLLAVAKTSGPVA